MYGLREPFPLGDISVREKKLIRKIPDMSHVQCV